MAAAHVMKNHASFNTVCGQPAEDGDVCLEREGLVLTDNPSICQDCVGRINLEELAKTDLEGNSSIIAFKMSVEDIEAGIEILRKNPGRPDEIFVSAKSVERIVNGR